MRNVLLILMVLALGACGDPATEDARGYTKAPLEGPGLLVAGEPESAVDVPVTLEPGLTAPLPAEDEGAGAGGSADVQEPGPEEAALAPGVTQEQFDQGEQLFSGRGGCHVCHGPDGSGTQLAPDLTDDEWLQVAAPEVDALVELIRDGVPDPQQFAAPMPPMGGADLSADQVRALAAYVATIAQR